MEMTHEHYAGTNADVCEVCGQELRRCDCPCCCGCQLIATSFENLCEDCQEGNHELPPRNIVEFELPLLKELIRNYEQALAANLWEQEEYFVRFNHEGMYKVE